MTKGSPFADFNPVSIVKSSFDTPFVASFPHSGLCIPPALRGLYTDVHLSRLRNTDWHLPALYSFLPEIGVDCVIANFSRYVIDVNRGLHQLHGGKSTRSQLIYTRDTEGGEIFKQWPQNLQSEYRINQYYKPFHAALKSIIETKKQQHGHACLLDMHSFAYGAKVDIALGDGRARDKAPSLKGQLSQAFRHAGFNAGEAARFPGGYIVSHYGDIQCEAVMIELKYRTYMSPSAERGDHIPKIDWDRASQTQAQLQRALTDVVSAPNQAFARMDKPRLAL